MLRLKKEEQKRKAEDDKWAKDFGMVPEDIEGILSAAKNGTVEDFKKLLTKEPRLAKYSSKDGTLLHIVCGHAMNDPTVKHAMVEALLKVGIDTNAIDDQGWTVLHNVVGFSKLVDVAQLLIAHGANVDAVGKNGQRPIHRANSVSMIELLLKKGADINVKDNAGHTPLDGLLFHLAGALKGRGHMEGDSQVTLFVRERGGVSPMEEAAQTAYDKLPEDEKLALTLRWSGKHWGVLAGGGPEVERAEVRKIGQYLYEHGGMVRMLKVHHRVVQLGGDGSYLELMWHEIGEWRA